MNTINTKTEGSASAMLANLLPEECHPTKAIRNAHFRIAHITRDIYGNYSERRGWLMTDIVCSDPSRVCIQYENTNVFIDVPAHEVMLLTCQEIDPAAGAKAE